MILVDATLVDSVPEALTTAAFFADLATHLTAGGVATMNLLAPPADTVTPRTVRRFREALPAAAVLLDEIARRVRAGRLPTGIEAPAVNQILVGRPRSRSIDCSDWAEAAARLTTTRRLKTDLGALVASECHALENDSAMEVSP